MHFVSSNSTLPEETGSKISLIFVSRSKYSNRAVNILIKQSPYFTTMGSGVFTTAELFYGAI